MTGTIVITRPEEDAKVLSATLIALGFHCIIESMLEIQPLLKNIPLLKSAIHTKPNAIIITSKHALSILANAIADRSIPIIAVGRGTADYATRLGFTDTTSAGGTAQMLMQFVKKHFKPDTGKLLYISGTEVSTDIISPLKKEGFLIDAITVYKAKAADHFSEYLCETLEAERIDAILFSSQRTAITYRKLALLHELDKNHKLIIALCMSQEIAQKLKALPWKSVHVCDHPHIESMVELTSRTLSNKPAP